MNTECIHETLNNIRNYLDKFQTDLKENNFKQAFSDLSQLQSSCQFLNTCIKKVIYQYILEQLHLPNDLFSIKLYGDEHDRDDIQKIIELLASTLPSESDRKDHLNYFLKLNETPNIQIRTEITIFSGGEIDNIYSWQQVIDVLDDLIEILKEIISKRGSI